MRRGAVRPAFLDLAPGAPVDDRGPVALPSILTPEHPDPGHVPGVQHRAHRVRLPQLPTPGDFPSLVEFPGDLTRAGPLQTPGVNLPDNGRFVLIDVLVSPKRDLVATRRFFLRVLEHGPKPD